MCSLCYLGCWSFWSRDNIVKYSRRYLDHWRMGLINTGRTWSNQSYKTWITEHSRGGNTLWVCVTHQCATQSFQSEESVAMDCIDWAMDSMCYRGPTCAPLALSLVFDPIHFSLDVYFLDLETLETITSLKACSTQFGLRMVVSLPLEMRSHPRVDVIIVWKKPLDKGRRFRMVRLMVFPCFSFIGKMYSRRQS